jgi:hypothetical protein
MFNDTSDLDNTFGDFASNDQTDFLGNSQKKNQFSFSKTQSDQIKE